MALVLEVEEGQSVYFGPDGSAVRVELDKVIHPMKFMVKIHGSMDRLVEIEGKTEILPEVFLEAGPFRYAPGPNKVKFVITAPKHIRILREKLYNDAD